MKLLHRRRDEHAVEDRDEQGRPLPDGAPMPQPEHEEPRQAEPTPTSLSKRD